MTRTDLSLTWSARLARLGVASRETQPRLLTTATCLNLGAIATGTWHGSRTHMVPLTDPQTQICGQVLRIYQTPCWLVAFGLVTDGETADLMRTGALVPEFALNDVRITPPADIDIATYGVPARTVTHGTLAAVRAIHNPRHRPGPEPLWSGLRFTVEDYLP